MRCWWQRVATHKTKTDYASLQHELCRSRCPSARFAPSLCLSAPLLLSSLCAVLRWCAPTRRGHRQRSESDRRSAPPSPLRAPLQPRSGGATLPRDAELLAECWLPALIVEGVCAAATAGRISSSSPMGSSSAGSEWPHWAPDMSRLHRPRTAPHAQRGKITLLSTLAVVPVDVGGEVSIAPVAVVSGRVASHRGRWLRCVATPTSSGNTARASCT